MPRVPKEARQDPSFPQAHRCRRWFFKEILYLGFNARLLIHNRLTQAPNPFTERLCESRSSQGELLAMLSKMRIKQATCRDPTCGCVQGSRPLDLARMGLRD